VVHACHRRELAASDVFGVVLARHDRCRSTQHVYGIPDDRCDMLPDLWASRRTGPR